MAKSNDRETLVPTALNLKKGSKGKDVKLLKNYLNKFGYLNPVMSESEGLEFIPEPEDGGHPAISRLQSNNKSKFDSATVRALKNFQEFNGVKPTGIVDEDTLEVMNRKRCGCQDQSAHADFSTHPNKWNKTNLTYGFLNFSPDIPQAQTRQAIEQAFALWAAETPLSFTRINDANSADIRIGFFTGDHDAGSDFDGAGGILAHAFFPPPNSGALAGDAHFDEVENWTINVPTGSATDLVTVAAHEFGHSLGLRHSSVAAALMAPSYSGPRRILHSDDVQGIQRHYGFYPIAQAPWVHGTDINIEYPERLDAIRRAGFYTHLYGKENTMNWFHFAVPSPVIVDGTRLRIARAMLRCRTHSKRAIIKHVHLYDGFTKIASHNDVNLTGDQWFAKFGVAHKPAIRWGLGISVGVEFKSGSRNQRRMDFVSAGVDLIK